MVESIRTRRAFSALSRSRDRGRSGPVWVVRAAEPTDDGVSVAYAIGRAVGGAVTRNRVRRRLRAIVADLDRAGRIPPGRYLVGVSPAAAQASFVDLRDHLTQALGRLAPTLVTS